MHLNALLLLCTLPLFLGVATGSFLSSRSFMFTQLERSTLETRAPGGCQKSSCVGVGTVCNDTNPVCTTDPTTNVTTCPACNAGLFCNAVSGHCDSNKYGILCTSNSDCSSSLLAHQPLHCLPSGVQKTCQFGPYLSAGDFCHNASQCFGGMTCTGNPTICIGVQANLPCNSSLPDSNDCAFGTFCNSNTGLCTTRIAAGGDCSTTASTQPNPCTAGHTCSNGTCVVLFSVRAGGDCSRDTTNSFGCLSSLTCDFVTGRCASIPTQAGSICDTKPCNATTGIEATLSCMCQPLTGHKECLVDSILGTSLGAACASSVNTALTCFQAHSCTTTDFFDGTCMKRNCMQPTACVLQCFYSRFQTLSTLCVEGYAAIQSICTPSASSGTHTGTGTNTATGTGPGTGMSSAAGLRPTWFLLGN